MQKVTDRFRNERRLRWIENSAALGAAKKYSVGAVAAGGSAAVVNQSLIGWETRQGALYQLLFKECGFGVSQHHGQRQYAFAGACRGQRFGGGLPGDQKRRQHRNRYRECGRRSYFFRRNFYKNH